MHRVISLDLRRIDKKMQSFVKKMAEKIPENQKVVSRMGAMAGIFMRCVRMGNAQVYAQDDASLVSGESPPNLATNRAVRSEECRISAGISGKHNLWEKSSSNQTMRERLLKPYLYLEPGGQAPVLIVAAQQRQF